MLGNYNVEKLRQETELTQIALVTISTQTAEAKLTETALSAALPPNNPPQPIFTPTPLPIPSGYVVLNQFDEQEPIDKNWVLINNSDNVCSANIQVGYLYMKCEENKQGDYRLEYASSQNDMRLLSGGASSGVAMSVKMLNPNQDKKAKVYFIVHLTGPDGTPSTRAYFMPMRFDNIKVVEAYPLDPLEPWKGIDLSQTTVDSTVFHIIQAELISGKISFYIDSQPVELQLQPNLPNGYTWQDWVFGVEINNWEDQPARLEALIDWIAVSKGQ